MENRITLTIEKLAGLGDGIATREGRRIFVPYTLAGDTVRARIVRHTKDADYAVPEEVIISGPGRITPVCRHFTACGGCSLQHMDSSLYNDFKQQTTREAVRKAGFDPHSVAPLVRLPPASRRRAEFKVQDGRLGYYAEGSHRLIEIEECKVLEPALEALVLRLKPAFASLRGLEGVQINGVDGGYDMVLSGRSSGGWRLQEDKDIVRVSVEEEGGMRPLTQSRPVTLTLGDVQVEIPPGAFLQACAEAQAIMTQHVLESAAGAGRVLDLFAGLGTYSFPLAEKSEVTAVESDTPMVTAMQKAAVQYNKDLKARRRDLFRDPVREKELAAYDLVVINPPRNGAKEQTALLARSEVKKLVMISCNPATFTRDARMLKEAGYTLTNALPIDQFSYSAHLEIIANFAL